MLFFEIVTHFRPLASSWRSGLHRIHTPMVEPWPSVIAAAILHQQNEISAIFLTITDILRNEFLVGMWCAKRAALESKQVYQYTGYCRWGKRGFSNEKSINGTTIINLISYFGLIAGAFHYQRTGAPTVGRVPGDMLVMSLTKLFCFSCFSSGRGSTFVLSPVQQDTWRVSAKNRYCSTQSKSVSLSFFKI